MPDVSRDTQAALAQQVREGRYEHNPQFAGGTPAPDRGPPLDAPPAPPEAPSAAAGDPSDLTPPETAAAASEPQEAPPHLVRMVHDDPRAAADGFERDDTGALLVPHALVDDLKGMGYQVQHKRERAA